MSPKEKAKELIKSFYPHVQWKLGQEDCLDRAKQCALISCNEVLGYMGADLLLQKTVSYSVGFLGI